MNIISIKSGIQTNQRTSPTHSESKMDEMAQDTFVQSEEDLQRMIKLGAWYDGDEESSVAVAEAADQSETKPSYNRNELFRWQVDKDEDDPDFRSRSTIQLPRTHTDIVQELMAKFDKVAMDGYEDTDSGPGASTVGSLVPTEDSALEKSSSCQDGASSELKDGKCINTHDVPDSGDNGSHGGQPETVALETQSVPQIVQTDGEPPAVQDKPRYYHIAHEILTSERTYVQGLRILEKVVHGAVKTVAMTNRSVLPENVRKEIFINAGEIYSLHFDLLRELEVQLEQWNSNSVVADVIAKRARFFKLYSDYAKGFDTAREAYIQWLKTSKQFRELIKIIESSRSLKGDHVPSFMILPIQRVPRYKLLLEDYLKHLHEGHPDVVNTKAALAVISETALHMNSTIVDLEGQALVLKIQKCFVGKDILIPPGRKFVGRGPATFIPGSGKEQEMILFLFSDILLVASSAARKRYKIHHKFYLKDLMVKVLEPSNSLKNAFCIAEKGASKLLRFCTKSEEERDIWIKKLNRGRAANSNYFTVNRKSEYAPVLHDPEAYESILTILKDPSFELGQPSWVRRSPPSAGSVTFPSVVMPGSNTKPPSYLLSPLLNVEEVDYPMEGEAEEIMMEFQEDEEKRERASLTKYLHPGIDNSLSSYMNQRSADGKIWRRRWFVLTNQTLICYENHLHDEAIGAIPLAGYTLSLPTEVDKVKRRNVLKLGHPTNRTYLFELPSCYDFEKWCSIMRELLESDLNSA